MAESLPDEELELTQHEYIASYIWESAYLSVAYYNTTTLELFIAHETVDLKPDYWHLKNLFRQLNVKTVLASGPNVFLTAIMELLNIPKDEKPVNFSVNRVKSTASAAFLVYNDNEKTLLASRKRILELRLSHMADLATDRDRHNFIETIIPLNQNLLVQALGNLLNYLDNNWKYLFLRTDRNPVISDVHIYRLDTHMLMDDASFHALQVFNLKDHPSGFKKSSYGSKREGFSLYSMMNKCASSIGSNELKMILQQPIRDMAELRARHATIEWLMDEKNGGLMVKLRSGLHNISNLSDLFQKLASTGGKPTIFRNFKRSLYYAKGVGDICIEAMEIGAAAVMNTIIEELGNFIKERKDVGDVLLSVNLIVDLEEGLKIGRFCVKYGLYEELDAKKQKIHEVIDVLKQAAHDEIKTLPLNVNEITVHFVHELGFLLAIHAHNQSSPEEIASVSSLKYVYRTHDACFFTNDLCVELNAKYGNLYTEICDMENQIFERLLDYMRDRLVDIQHAGKLCARLDAFMSMASFCMAQHLRKPELLADDKVLEIKNGRHIMVEKFKANSTTIDVLKKNLVTVLIAPNGSGKSVYLKEIAQIVYLAQIGCFVPAEAVSLSPFDAVYTRIYSPESMHQAKSSFLVELQQMGMVMSSSSTDSLILVDEFGQGTHARDGQALVQSCLEHLNNRGALAPITIFSTHYTSIYETLANCEWIRFKTFRMLRDVNGSVSSTFELVDGQCLGNHAKDLAEVKEFLHRATTATCNEQQGLTGPNDNQDRGIVDIAEKIYQAKIRCAAECVHAYMKNKQTNDPAKQIDIVQLFKNYRL